MDESPKRGLLAAYGRLLGPLIRILIRNGVSFGEFAEVAKRAYVEVAARDFRVVEDEVSEQRVAVLSGLRPEEVKRIQDKRKKEATAPRSYLDEITRILHGWHTDSSFTGPYGVPLELRPNNQGINDFDELVKRYAGEITPERALKELLKIGAVVETQKGWFKALFRHYTPEPAGTEGLDHLSRSIQDFVNTLEFNRLEPDQNRRLFERQVYTEFGILPENVERFRNYAGPKAQLLLEEIDNWLSQLEEPKSRQQNQRKKITGLGIFHYVRDEDTDQASY